MVLTFKNNKNIQLNTFLKNLGFTDGYIYKLMSLKNVSVSGEVVSSRYIILPKRCIVSVVLFDEDLTVIPTKGDLDIVYEDEYFLIVNKEKDLLIEPTIEDNENTLSNYVANYYLSKDIKSNIHIVNRLDRVTSGLVVFAKNGFIHNLMSKTKITKKYLALVTGTVFMGKIEIRIKKSDEGIKRILSDDGKKCITYYKRIKKDDGNSLCEVLLKTGRTHQIRVSFSSIGHPLVGDLLYGKDNGLFFLHSCFLSFIHPVTKRKIRIKSTNYIS